MRARKYTEFSVAKHVNVSSTGHYSFRIHVKGCRSKNLYWDGDGDFWADTYIPAFPKYVIKGLEHILLDVLRADDTVFYENDRYGGRRSENLRYHDVGVVQRWIARLEREQGRITATNPMQMKWSCVCGHNLETRGYRKSMHWIGTEVAAWCAHCSTSMIVYADETDKQVHTRTLRDDEELYYGDEAEGDR